MATDVPVKDMNEFIKYPLVSVLKCWVIAKIGSTLFVLIYVSV